MSLFDRHGKLALKRGKIQGDLTKLSQKELVKLVEDMAHDWAKMNSAHNRRARQENWCTEYEKNQSVYNRDFKVLRLKGRNGRSRRDDSRNEVHISPYGRSSGL